MAESLKRSSLRVLALYQLTVSDDTIKALAEALTANENLKRLCLHKCHLSDKSALELAKMLRVNATLNSVELSETQIGDQGAAEIATALLHPSSSVKKLEIFGNTKIQQKGILAIVRLAEQSYVLETLKLFGFSRTASSEEQMEIQRTINSCMNLNSRTNNTSRAHSKRPKVWYE